MRFIAFDLETTGTLPGIDQIVEIGAVRFVEGQVDALFSTLIDPRVPMPEAASRVNGINDSMLKDQPKIEDVLVPFAEFCGDDILVAHNAPFDVQFLTSDIQKHESAAAKGTILDTCNMARKVLPGLLNYKLGTLIEHLKIPAKGFHRAEEDASYCGLLFIKMIERISPGAVMPPLANLIALTGKAPLKFPQIERQPKQLDLLSLF
jgi:DNA polymerase-3 subunit epsilon